MKPLRIGILNFECSVLKNELPVLLAFGAEWDRDSRRLYGLLEAASKKYDKKIITGIVDLDYAIDIFCKCKVYDYPTIIFFEDGKEIMRKTGISDSHDVENFIRKFYGVFWN